MSKPFYIFFPIKFEIITAAALAAFNDSTFPYWGIVIFLSAKFNKARLGPLASLDIINTDLLSF